MMLFSITLKSGHTVVVSNGDKNPIGLWRWSMKQAVPQVLSFDDDVAILSSEISMIRPLGEDIGHGTISETDA